MIVRENIINVTIPDINNMYELHGYENLFNKALFFDLEHYVYKNPICIGVFGCCYYNEDDNTLKVTQYMIEKKSEAALVVKMARDYFETYYKAGKTYIVTFSGNNDFSVINYLFKKYKIKYSFEIFKQLDIQEIFRKDTGICTGLKAIEKSFNIARENAPISGANLAKTFSKIMKDDGYILRMPKDKIEKILLYNQQDVVSLFEILANWNLYISQLRPQE